MGKRTVSDLVEEKKSAKRHEVESPTLSSSTLTKRSRVENDEDEEDEDEEEEKKQTSGADMIPPPVRQDIIPTSQVLFQRYTRAYINR